jgi:DNA-directed RNA polymerase specialized sigma subunit
MAEGMDEISVLRERYRQAMEYMAWFVPAWEELSEDDRYVLDAFYSEDNEYGSSAAEDVAEYFGIERASAYRRKNRALAKLTTLLFGKP